MYNEEEAARPYARALVQAAQNLGCMARVREDMEALSAQWVGSEVFREWAKRFHSMPRAKHREVVAALWGQSVCPPVRVLLSEHGLMAVVPQVVRCFRRLADVAEGRRDVVLSFAAEPSAQTLSTLTAKAKAAYGEQTRITVEVRPELGAGVMIRAGHTQFDGTLSGRLRRLSRAFGR